MKIINLLPKEKQKTYLQRKLFKVIISLMWVTAGSFLLVIIAQFATRTFFIGQRAQLAANIENLKTQIAKDDHAVVRQKIKKLNDLVIDYKNLYTGVPKFSKVVRAFAKLVPEGVRIKTLRVDAQKKFIEVNGYSETREQVIQFYENVLHDSQNFPNIDYPLENVAKQQKIDFHFTFNVSEGLLK